MVGGLWHNSPIETALLAAFQKDVEEVAPLRNSESSSTLSFSFKLLWNIDKEKCRGYLVVYIGKWILWLECTFHMHYFNRKVLRIIK